MIESIQIPNHPVVFPHPSQVKLFVSQTPPFLVDNCIASCQGFWIGKESQKASLQWPSQLRHCSKSPHSFATFDKLWLPPWTALASRFTACTFRNFLSTVLQSVLRVICRLQESQSKDDQRMDWKWWWNCLRIRCFTEIFQYSNKFDRWNCQNPIECQLFAKRGFVWLASRSHPSRLAVMKFFHRGVRENPGIVDLYIYRGFCWLIRGSKQGIFC